jgi:hypothetical protein
MICILGYSANASAIALEVAVGNEEEMGTEHLAVQAATAFWLVIKLTRGEWGLGTGSESRAEGWGGVKQMVGCLGGCGCDGRWSIVDGRRWVAQDLDSNSLYDVPRTLGLLGS